MACERRHHPRAARTRLARCQRRAIGFEWSTASHRERLVSLAGGFVYALTQVDSFIDVSEEDLMRIYMLATGRHREEQAK
jgi:hypothetical protein